MGGGANLSSKIFGSLAFEPLNGFTLAEILITLGIIGVVAALTMPALIANYQKQEILSRLKKSYTVINQALKMSENDNGEYKYWDTDLSPDEYLNNYWLPYINVNQLCTDYSVCGYKSNTPWSRYNRGGNYTRFIDSTWRRPFLTADGILYSISVKGGNEFAKNLIIVDVNGPKKPNRFGHDVYLFSRTAEGGIRPFGYDKSSDEIDTNCKRASDMDYCAAKIIKDGWQFAKDYEW